MYFVRVSLLVPTAANAKEISTIQKELGSYFAAKEGFVDGYYLEAADESGVVGRITVWDNAEHAARAANDDHVMAQRSTLLLLMEHQIVAQGFHATKIVKP
jgi:hypothetical protein